MFDKGYNYTSTTFVNIYLQRYIDEMFIKFNASDRNDLKIDCDIEGEVKRKDTYLFNRIFQKPVITYKFFDAINELFPPSGSIVQYTDRLAILEQKLKIAVAENNNYNRILYTKILIEMITCGIYKSTRPKTDRRKFFRKFILVLYTILFEYCTLLRSPDTKRFIYSKELIINDRKILALVGKIDMEDKREFQNPPNKYTIVYMQFMPTDHTHKIAGKIMLHIVPHDGNINMYGLDEHYIPVGTLINKIADYVQQVNVTRLRDDSKEYQFIHDIIDII
jgi:hypothetical protein